jgi:polyisoprenoid-binding protein YceI
VSATATALPAGTYVDDGVHSSAGFAVKHMLSTFRGAFARLHAELTVADDGRARLVGTVPVDSVVIKDESLAAHLQSPEFFDAERFPEIRFESREVAIDGSAVRVEGDLTVRGHTEPVTARGSVAGPIDDPYGTTKVGLQLEAIVDRTRFGITWNAPLPKGGSILADEVILTVDLELART